MVDSFTLAGFCADGRFVGKSLWKVETLSQHWVNNFAALIHHHGPIFKTSLPTPLENFVFQLTANGGAGILTIYANSHIAASALLLAGSIPDVDAEIEKLFYASIMKSKTATVQDGRPPFVNLLENTERPIVNVVGWGNPSVSNDDEGLIKEMLWNFSGAFFNSPAVLKLRNEQMT